MSAPKPNTTNVLGSFKRILMALLVGHVGFAGCAAELGSEERIPEPVEPGLVSDEDVDAEWTLTYADEFETLDLSRYNTEFVWPRETIINDELQFYVDPETHDFSPFEINQGVLSITAQETPDSLRNVTSQAYVSGVLTSRQGFEQLYGKYEIRAKLPKGKGLWPAFWALPTYESWPEGVEVLPELDIMEYLGDEGSTYHTTRHTNQSGSLEQEGKAVEAASDLNSEFHVYAAVWGPSQIDWLFDGEVVFSSQTPADFDHPKHFLLNLAVGGTWPGNPDDSTAFPARFEVDYVRVYQKTDMNYPEAPGAAEGTGLGAPVSSRGEVYSRSSAEIFWQPADNYPVAMRYQVSRDGAVVANTDGQSHFDSDLAPGTTYTYEVRAMPDGDSPSAPARVVITTQP